MVGIGETRVRLEFLENALEADAEETQKRVSRWCSDCFEVAAGNIKIPRETVSGGNAGTIQLPVRESPLPIPENGWITAVEEIRLTLA